VCETYQRRIDIRSIGHRPLAAQEYNQQWLPMKTQARRNCRIDHTQQMQELPLVVDIAVAGNHHSC